MAVPKCKVSSARRDKRRGSNWKLSAPSVAVCPKCGEPVQPHRACKACGTYNGRQVLAAKADSGRKHERKAYLPSSFPLCIGVLSKHLIVGSAVLLPQLGTKKLCNAQSIPAAFSLDLQQKSSPPEQ